MNRLSTFIQSPLKAFDRNAWSEETARRAFAAVLIVIGLLGLVETVIAPGRIIRRPMGFSVVDPFATTVQPQVIADDISTHPTVAALDSVLGTNRMRQESREKANREFQQLKESRYQLARQPLDEVMRRHESAWERFLNTARQQLSIDLSSHPYDTTKTPPRLNRLVLEDESVKLAWSGLRQLAKEGHALRSDVINHNLTKSIHLSTDQELSDYRTRTDVLAERASKHIALMEQSVRLEVDHIRIALDADRRLNP